VALRVGLAAIVLNLVVRATGLRIPTDRRVWGAFFGMGLICLGLAAIDGRIFGFLRKKKSVLVL